MAELLKCPTKNTKGALVFTHKEWPWLLQSSQQTLMDFSQYFFLGWNQGTYFNPGMDMPDVIDFAFTSPNMNDFRENGRTLKLPYCDRNFLLDEFKNLDIKEKTFDFICVSRAIKWKKLPALLQAFRKMLDAKREFTALLVVPTAENEKDGDRADAIVDIYKDLFNHEERKDIILNRLSPELGFMGMSPKMINWLYNHSKISYIGSESEGTCRAVHEALIGGCHIVYNKNHKGGLVDYLNNTNSVSYTDYNKLDKSLLKALDNYSYDKKKTDDYDFLLSERHSYEKLIPWFEKLYKNNGQEFDGTLINIDNLSNRLPAHYLDVPWFKDGNGVTADIENNNQLQIFVNYINETINENR